METRSIKQKPKETEEQEEIRVLQEEELEEPTKIKEKTGQFEEETHNKVMIDETKNCDDLVKTLKAHDHCERDRKRLDESKYYNRGHYNKYQYGKYNHGGQERDNYNYTRVVFTRINSSTITIRDIKDFRIIGDGITTEMDNTKIHTDLENRREREEMMETLKNIKMKMRTIDQVEEM
ncbi:hypothetical protein FQA39_LY17903 [Lamprigera yunnana]|nr:hypothetical protein FQA39_LY17903 [Lamprigera yunnana]